MGTKRIYSPAARNEVLRSSESNPVQSPEKFPISQRGHGFQEKRVGSAQRGWMRVPVMARHRAFFWPRHNGISSIVFSAPGRCSPRDSPSAPIEHVGCPLEMVPFPPVDSVFLPKRMVAVAPGEVSSLVNALWLATRKIMSNGAMTYSLHLETEVLRSRCIMEI